MPKVLMAWIGRTDLRAPVESKVVGLGPIAQALDSRSYDRVVLLADYEKSEVEPYVSWLKMRSETRIDVLWEKLAGPTNFGEIHQASVRSVLKVLEQEKQDVSLTFHLSPGTPAMASIWILLGKTRFPAELIESSKEHGVRTASVPFDISADFLPDLLRERDERLQKLSQAEAPTAPEFKDIVHRSDVMKRLILKARRVAVRNVPVLIEGESGTGKELFAHAIHRASPRKNKEFVVVNCGAIPSELVESQLFGHEKGAFTNADRQHRGFFEAADGGTLFLDELGELPLAAQVKMLRALQQGEVLRVGSNKPIKVDVRVVAATNRKLTEEIAAGRFREDLFYRIAVAVLNIPPLRDRREDLTMLIAHALEGINRDAANQPGYQDKKLSAGAKNLLLAHDWPGNVRELLNTLQRAAIWSDSSTISTEDIREAILPSAKRLESDVLHRPLGSSLNLSDLLRDVARHYLERAMEESHGNKTRAAELVGLPSYQTLSNWLTKYEVQS